MGCYRDLRVYQDAFALAMELFQVLQSFPDDEKYDLVRQLRRSSRSVRANLAEAWRRRRYPAAFVAKLIDAEAEASEARVHLEFAHACGYLPAGARDEFDRRYDRLLARLAAMRSRPDRWIPRPRPKGRGPTPHPEADAREPALWPGSDGTPVTSARAAAKEVAPDPGSVSRRGRPSTVSDDREPPSP